MLRARLVVASGFVAFSLAAAGCHDQPGDAASESALNANPKTNDFVIEADNSVRMQSGGLVVRGGDIGARGKSGPYLAGGAAIDVSGGVWFQSSHSMLADSVRLEWGSVVGSIQTNDLIGGNRGWHGRVGPFIPIPALPAAAAPAPGTAALSIAAGASATAAPGAFGSVNVGNGGKLRLPAGNYDFADLTLGNNARLEAQGAVQIHVAGRLAAKNGVFIGGAAGAGLTARGIRLEVSGPNGGDGSMGASPKAVAFGRDTRLTALVLVPNGTLLLGDDSDATGAFFARDVDVGGSGSHVLFQDGFPAVSGPPTCAASSCDDGNPCTTDGCDASGACTHAPALVGTSCSDGNACNGAEACDGAGACRPGTPVTCAASDQCHDAGVCDPATGACSNPAKSNGTVCDDGNACTLDDTCQAGACASGATLNCAASDQCHAAGVCDPASGLCSNPAKADGASCNDGNACTQSDSCQAGVCTGANPVVCPAADQCHLGGTCDTSTGVCSNPAKADGASCNDGNSCTAGDMCVAGACMPGTASCDSIAIVEKVNGGRAFPQLANTISADRTLAVPGDAVAFTSNVTNLGTTLDVSGEIDLTNKGSSTFTVAGYQETVEYLSVASNGWVPVAKIAVDATGAVVPDPTMFAFSWAFASPISEPGVTYSADPIVGTTVSPGAMAAWGFRFFPILPGDVVSTIFDPSKASAVRLAMRFDTTSGPVPAPGTADLSSMVAGVTGRIENPAVTVSYSGGASSALTPAVPGPIAPGATLAFTGVVPATLIDPKGATETDAAYINRIWFDTFFSYFATALASGHAVGTDPPSQSAGLFINTGIPVITISSGAPTLGNGGLTSTYDVTLSNSMGNADAGPFSIEDAVNGVSVPTINSVPSSVGPGGSGTATVMIATPMGPYTNALSVTWQDRNGNVYGPVSYTQ
jgi:hypothetical protein